MSLQPGSGGLAWACRRVARSGWLSRQLPETHLSGACCEVAEASLSGGGAQMESLCWPALRVSFRSPADRRRQPLVCPWSTCGCHPHYPCLTVGVWVWGGQLCPALQPESRGSQGKEITYSEITCSSMSFDKHMHPCNPHCYQDRAVPPPESSLLPLPGSVHPQATPVLIFFYKIIY